MKANEDKIIAELRNNSESAFKQLFEKYSAGLYNFIIRISGGNGYLAEEIVQRTFIKVWEVRQNIDSEKSFFSFLCTIAKNMLINDLERKTIEFIYKEYYRLNLDSRHENADNQLNINILQEIIDNLAEKLPPGRKKVFGLFQKNELSVREIAAKLGLSESAVRTQLTKALDFMRENIKKYYLVLYFLLYVNFS